MSRQELAEAVNAYLWATYQEQARLDRGYVGKLELGKHRWPRARCREAFRHVLKAASDAEIGFFITRDAMSSGAVMPQPGVVDAPVGAGGVETEMDRRDLLTSVVTPGLTAVVAAVLSPLADDSCSGIDVDSHLHEVAGRLAAIRGAYQHSRYAFAAQALAGLLRELARLEAAGADRQRLAVISAQAHQVAASVLLKGEQPVVAAVAAERSVAAARVWGDEVTIASSMRAVVHTVICGGQPKQAASLAIRSARRLEDRADMDDPAALSVYGALLLRGAIAAATSEDRDQARQLLDEAARAAGHLGSDANLNWTGFGPANVAAHRVAVAVELGDAGKAVQLASGVDVSNLALPERKAMLLLDTARALTQWGKWERALNAIREAEQYAPQEVRTRPVAHHLIRDLALRAPVLLQPRVREYACRVGAMP